MQHLAMLHANLNLIIVDVIKMNNDVLMKLIPLAFVSIFLFGTLKTFIRTGLRGELIRSIGIASFLISYLANNNVLLIISFIVFNIGWIILVTIELEKRKYVFSNTTIIDRLFGNVPNIRIVKFDYKNFNKTSGVASGVVCILIVVLAFLNKWIISDIDAVFYGMIFFAGIFFIVFSLTIKEK